MRNLPRAAMVVAGLASALLAAGCQDGATSGPGVGLQLHFLTDDVSSGIPDDAQDAFLSICIVAEGDDCGDNVSYTWIGDPTAQDGLFAPKADIDHDGRPEELVQDLPLDTTLKVAIAVVPAVDPTAAHPVPDPTAAPLYSTRFDGVRLAKGERRFLPVTLYPVNRFATVGVDVSQAPDDFTGRFGATATALPDGRVLIAGGFDTVGTPMTLANCRAVIAGAPDGAICFQLVASNKAFIFEPGSGRIYELAAPMSAGGAVGRAFHNAVALPDGRVVLAGGVDVAILELAPLADGSGYEPNFVPVSGSGMVGYLNTFEIFDPTMNALDGDPNRDGNPERGGFQEAGTLAVGRAFSAGALWPDPYGENPPRVVLFGGLDPSTVTTHPSTSWEYYDDSSGTFTLGTGSIGKARAFSAAGLMRFADPAQLWLIGGVSAPTGDFDLVSVWSADGAILSSPLPPTGTENPGRNFWMPEVTPLGSIDTPVAQLVFGSYGPMCDSSTDPPTPTYDLTIGTLVRCPPSVLPPYVINRLTALRLDSIVAWTPADSPHVLGAAATLGDGSAVVVGGAADLHLAATKASHRITWSTAGTGAATKDSTMLATAFPVAALLPAAASTVGGDALFVGGMSVTLAPTPSVTLLDDVVLFNHE